MARNGDGSTEKGLYSSTPPVTGYPWTMCCWFRAATAAQYMNVMTLADSASLRYWTMDFDGDNSLGGGDNRLVCIAQDGGGENVATSTATITAGTTWNHCCAVFSSATSRTIYLRGGNSATNTTSTAASSIDDFAIGFGYFAAGATGPEYSPIDGDVAEAAVWNAALTAAEVLSLSKGFAPPLVRPANLTNYWPLFGRHGPEPDLWGTLPLTLHNGTMAQAAHPPVIFRPQGMVLGRHTDAAGATTRGTPFGPRGTAFNGGRIFKGLVA